MESSIKHRNFINETFVSYKTKLIAASGLTLFIFLVLNNSHNQWITGSIVNEILVLITVLAGSAEAVCIGLFPGFIALSNGILPPCQIAAIPVVMIGNIIFVITFHCINTQGFIIAAISASLLNFFSYTSYLIILC